MLETIFSSGLIVSQVASLKLNNKKNIYLEERGKKTFIFLTPRAKKTLEKYLEVREQNESPYLFIPLRGKNAGKKDKKISANYIQQKIKEYRERLGLNPSISAHSLRYGFRDYLHKEAIAPKPIERLFEHESLDTTTRYVNPSDRYAEKVHHRFHPLKER